jgi:hypothetical protein
MWSYPYPFSLVHYFGFSEHTVSLLAIPYDDYVRTYFGITFLPTARLDSHMMYVRLRVVDEDETRSSGTFGYFRNTRVFEDLHVLTV